MVFDQVRILLLKVYERIDFGFRWFDASATTIFNALLFIKYSLFLVASVFEVTSQHFSDLNLVLNLW